MKIYVLFVVLNFFGQLSRSGIHESIGTNT